MFLKGVHEEFNYIQNIEQVTVAYLPLFGNAFVRVAPCLSQENLPCEEFPWEKEGCLEKIFM